MVYTIIRYTYNEIYINYNVASFPFGHPQQVTITRQGPGCPEQRISFQCTTVESTVIAWESTHYIGSNLVQIDFSDSKKMSIQKRSTKFNDTVAVLTSKDSSLRVLTSILNVTATSVNLNPSVTCINGDHSTKTTFSFNVIDKFLPLLSTCIYVAVL